jgi:DNA-binding response OmpR family regulator
LVIFRRKPRDSPGNGADIDSRDRGVVLAGSAGRRFAVTVAIVEDDDTLRGILAKFLAGQHDVETFARGDIALAAFRKQPPQVLLADLDLPGVSGETLASAVRVRGRPTRVVLMSGNTRRLERARFLADATLNKPFRLADVKAAVCGASPKPG